MLMSAGSEHTERLSGLMPLCLMAGDEGQNHHFISGYSSLGFHASSVAGHDFQECLTGMKMV